MPCVGDMNILFADNGYKFTFRIIANEEYNDLVLKPILLASDGVADTSELFLRSYQMYKMFAETKVTEKRTRTMVSTLVNYNARVDDHVILERESWWKETLQSRAFGYNSN